MIDCDGFDPSLTDHRVRNGLEIDDAVAIPILGLDRLQPVVTCCARDCPNGRLVRSLFDSRSGTPAVGPDRRCGNRHPLPATIAMRIGFFGGHKPIHRYHFLSLADNWADGCWLIGIDRVSSDGRLLRAIGKCLEFLSYVSVTVAIAIAQHYDGSPVRRSRDAG